MPRILAIQFARLSGFSPIITTSSLKNEAYLKSLGATHVIDRHTPLSDLPRLVKEITDKPVKYAYDALSSPETQNAVFELVVPGGQIVFLNPLAIDEAKLKKEDKYIGRVFADVQQPTLQEIGKSLYAHITQLVEAGDIKVRTVRARM